MDTCLFYAATDALIWAPGDFLSFWRSNGKDFRKDTQIISPPSCHLRILIVALVEFWDESS